MMREKRIFSLFLALMICLSLLPMGALASGEASTEPEEVIEAVAEEIIGAEEPVEAEESVKDEVLIEDVPEGLEAVEAAAASDSDFVIEDGVLTKYNGAGGDVIIPDGVTSIGSHAFYWCTSLTNVTIPGSVTSIGEYAFDDCFALTSVTIPGSVTTIGYAAFSSCGLTSVTIPGSVTSIGDYAFAVCKSLTSVTIPGSITSISSYTFAGCSSLTDVTIPDSVTTIGEAAFARCTSLTNVTIPDSVMTIGDSAFEGCDSLTSVTFMGDAPTIEETQSFGYIGYMGVFFWVTATVHYPAGNSTWTSEVKDKFGEAANLTWVEGDGQSLGDITGDGAVNLKDVTKLFQFVNKQIATL